MVATSAPTRGCGVAVGASVPVQRAPRLALTSSDEVLLAKQIEAGLYAQYLMENPDAALSGSADRPADADLRSLVTEGVASRVYFMQANAGLVVFLARKFQHRGLPLADLVQEGNLGLARAVDRFDWALGFKFSTYASWWIKQAVMSGLRDARLIKLPSVKEDLLRKVYASECALVCSLGREPSLVEVAEAAGVSVAELGALADLVVSTVSLEASVGEGGFGGVAERVADEGAMLMLAGVESALDGVALRRVLGSRLAQLTERQQEALRLRFGLGGEAAMTLDEAAVLMGVSRERIRQLEQRALAVLRQPEHLETLRPHY